MVFHNLAQDFQQLNLSKKVLKKKLLLNLSVLKPSMKELKLILIQSQMHLQLQVHLHQAHPVKKFMSLAQSNLLAQLVHTSVTFTLLTQLMQQRKSLFIQSTLQQM